MTTSIKARPSIYNGIPMRSRLEARVAAWLDSLGVLWEYEPVAFASPDGQYLPDFRLVPVHDSRPIARQIYLEVKGRLDYDETRALMDRMVATIGASDQRAHLVIADAENVEAGVVYTYHYPSLGMWASVHLLPFLVDAGVVPMPESWRLPEWDAQ